MRTVENLSEPGKIDPILFDFATPIYGGILESTPDIDPVDKPVDKWKVIRFSPAAVHRAGVNNPLRLQPYRWTVNVPAPLYMGQTARWDSLIHSFHRAYYYY